MQKFLGRGGKQASAEAGSAATQAHPQSDDGWTVTPYKPLDAAQKAEVMRQLGLGDEYTKDTGMIAAPPQGQDTRSRRSRHPDENCGTTVSAGTQDATLDRVKASQTPENMDQLLQQFVRKLAGLHNGAAPASAPNRPLRKQPLAFVGSQRELRARRRACRGDAFVDPDFTPSFNEHVKQWCRPCDIGACDFKPVKPNAQWYMFRGQPSVDDVSQGMLGDCWFLSALGALAEFHDGRHLKTLLPGQTEVCREGVYLVRLCLAGRWHEILVDDRVPCVGGEPPYLTHPAYAHLVRRQLWASLIEKAFAKACGSYDALSGGEASEALTVLTGWPCTVHFLGRSDFDAESLWVELVSSKKAGFLLTCTSSMDNDAMRAVGLVDQHAYALLAAISVTLKGNRTRLLKLRNPQGNTPERRWTGPWSQTSNLWTTKLRERLDYHEDSGEGVLFMSFDDFQRHYDHVTVCRIRSSDWSESRVSVELPLDAPPLTGALLETSEEVECAVTLHQAEKRIRYGPFFKGDFEPLACIGYVMLDASGAGVMSPSALGRMRHRSTVTAECRLAPGRYFVVPLSLTRGASRAATLVCHTSTAVSFTVVRLDPSIVRSAWAAYAKHPCQNEDDKETKRCTIGDGDGVLTVRQGSGACVVALAENHGCAHLSVELGFISTGMRYSRQIAVTTDWLPPGHAQVLQVAFPIVEETQVPWAFGPNLFTSPLAPRLPLHTPDIRQDGDEVLHASFPMFAMERMEELRNDSLRALMKLLKGASREGLPTECLGQVSPNGLPDGPLSEDESRKELPPSVPSSVRPTAFLKRQEQQIVNF